MAQTSVILRPLGDHDSGLCEVSVVETFTHKCVLSDGTVLRGDPANGFWGDRWGSYYGPKPMEWNEATTVEEGYRDSYVCTADYS
jgi:hypothetical protein